MLHRLLYRGRDIDALQDQCAKQARIDDPAPVRTTHEVLIDAPIERVWELLSNPAGWPSAQDRRRVHRIHRAAVTAN
jgi:uncharacterized membrane protein